MKTKAYIFGVYLGILAISGCHHEEILNMGGISGSILFNGAKNKPVEGVMLAVRHANDTLTITAVALILNISL